MRARQGVQEGFPSINAHDYPCQLFLVCTGTPEAKVIKKPDVLPEVLNDLEEDYTPDDDSFASMVQNQKSLRATIGNVIFYTNACCGHYLFHQSNH